MSLENRSEGEVLERIEKGLKRAVQANQDLSWEHGTKIKKQKYTDQAIDHFSDAPESPITRSWFKYGRTQPAAPSGSNRVPQFDSAPVAGSEDRIFQTTIEDFEHFFKYFAESPPLDRKHWFQKDMVFLRSFYKYNAPEWIKPIYLKNLDIRMLFWNIKSDLRSILDTKETNATSLSDFGGSEQNVDYYEQFGRNGSELLMELEKNSEFDDIIEITESFVRFVEDTLLKLRTLSQSDLQQEHVSVIQDIEQDFFDEFVWETIASVISKHTAEGPNSEVIDSLAESNIKENIRNHETKLSSYKSRCTEINLRPTPGDYSSKEDAVGDMADDLVTTVDKYSEEPEIGLDIE